MNFLHLEDNDLDAELFEILLRKEWPDCRINRMWTLRELEAALQLENYDLILSDYSMAGFDGLAALDVARACSPETPFIFLSGTIGEERAIEALKHGAADYVLKSSPSKLISVMQGALTGAQREIARRRAEESLRKNREQFRQISENIDDFIVLLDTTGRCLYCNPALQRLLGKGGGGGTNIFNQVHPEDLARVHRRLEEAVDDSVAVDLDYRVLLADGSVRNLEARASLLTGGDTERPTLLLAGRDVTKRKQAEELLIEQASLLANARDAICLFDLDSTIRQWNASAERIYGVAADAAIGRSVRDLLFSKQVQHFDAALALTLAHGEWQGEFRFPHPNGRDLVMESSWSLVHDSQGRRKSILCIDTDVTSRKQLELELQRAQRIEGLGMLAGGIAHDLNNILSPILLSVNLLRPLAVTDNDRLVIDTLETSATHGTELIQQILLFARGDEGQRAEIGVGQILADLERFLKTAVRRNMTLSMNYEDDLWMVSADATQLKQVLTNLCVNARDAMPGGGSIGITAANIRVQAGSLRGFHGEVPAGAYVRLSVTDTGTGIAPDAFEKIFDPFFTTKEIGKGTGLGLSTIAGIVQNHQGAIQVESVLGRGSTFHIYLPALDGPALPGPLPPVNDCAAGHAELILVIDDDEGIRFVAEKMLEAAGYHVSTAADGPSGLEELRRQQGRIQVVICDHFMPGMTGSAVLAQIRREAPDVKLIAMSGLHEELSSPDAKIEKGVARLPKPLTSDSLLRALRQVIDGVGV
jgi:PAS domain S-box-containing protein